MSNIKWSVITSTNYKDAHIFVRFLTKLAESVDPKRTEIIFVGEHTPLLSLIESKVQCKIVNSSPTIGWQNQGKAIAEGDYVLFIDNATLVPTNFLVRFTYCFENSGALKTDADIGLVVPLTNADEVIPAPVNSQRVVKSPKPTDVQSIQAELDNLPASKKVYTVVGEVSNFCMFMHKSIFDLVGDFNDKIKGEVSQATEFAARLIEHTKYTVVASDVYVYREYPFEEESAHLLAKNYRPIDQKLAIGYRIKIDDIITYNTFLKSLQKSATLTKNIIIVDDNSKVKVKIKLKEDHPDLWSAVSSYDKFSLPYDEKRDYNLILDIAERDGMDWILMLEDSEILEDRVDKHLFNKLMNPISCEVMGYTLQLYYMWDQENMWRSDGIWGNTRDVRLFKVIKGLRISKEGVLASNTGYGPDFPPSFTKDSSIKLKCLGYTYPALRQRRVELFEKADRAEHQGLFDHFVDTTGLALHPFKENNTLSIYSPVNRENDLLQEWLNHTWYFADELVLGDDGLSSETLERLHSYGVVTPKIVMKESFAVGRNQCLESCTKNYILQLDIDERVATYGWFCISRLMDHSTARFWLFPITNLQKDGVKVITDTIRLFPNNEGVFYTGILHETIDDYIRKFNVPTGISPINLVHMGYVLQSNSEAFVKMQKYLELNLKQLTTDSYDGRAYYNTALHLIEDELIDDAMGLLKICVALPPQFALPYIELAQLHIKYAAALFNKSLQFIKDQDFETKNRIQTIVGTLQRIQPSLRRTAPGHCSAYFQQQPKKYKELLDHIKKMSDLIEEKRRKLQGVE